MVDKGYTYRMLLRAVLYASENSDHNTVILMHNDVHAKVAVQYMCCIVRPIGGFAKVVPVSKTIELGNRSKIWVYSINDDPNKLRGIKINRAFYDNPLIESNNANTNRWKEMLMVLAERVRDG